MPEGDNRHRVNTSSRFYVAELLCGTQGCTVNISESAERVRARKNGQSAVTFRNRKYPLHHEESLAEFVSKFLRGGCTVYVGGKRMAQEDNIIPAPFIYVATTEAFKLLRLFHPQTLK